MFSTDVGPTNVVFIHMLDLFFYICAEKNTRRTENKWKLLTAVGLTAFDLQQV